MIDPDARLKLAQQMSKAIPHSAALGMCVEEIGEGVAVMSIPYDERFIGDPVTGVMHGGVLTALLDSCCGTCVMTHPKAPGNTATIDLRIDYMRAAKVGARVTARAECYRMTRNVAFVRAFAHDGDPNDPVATANGAFTVDGPSRKIGEKE